MHVPGERLKQGRLLRGEASSALKLPLPGPPTGHQMGMVGRNESLRVKEMRLVPSGARKDRVTRTGQINRAPPAIEQVTIVGPRPRLRVLRIENLGWVRLADDSRGTLRAYSAFPVRVTAREVATPRR